MSRFAKTKLIWLAVALVPLLVAIGCSAIAQDSPLPNEPPAPVPAETVVTPSVSIEASATAVAETKTTPISASAETETPTAQITTDTTARLTIDSAIIERLVQKDGSMHTVDEGVCEQVDFEVPISTATRVISIYCFDLSGSGFQLTSQIEELQPPDEGDVLPQNEIDGWRAICDILGVNPALYDCFEDYNGKFAANHLLPRRAHVRTDGEICFDGPILTDCD